MSGNVRVEDGLVVGTSGNKYTSRNPLARLLVSGFDRSVSRLAALPRPKTVLEVGCGEGHVVDLLLKSTHAAIHATDISANCIAEARARISSDRVTFGVQDIMRLERPASPPDLVVCCEVLEHLQDPLAGVDALSSLGAEWYLLSVPREPLWRALNVARGAYLADWGNSPGHLNHWSKQKFVDMIATRFAITAVRSPLPWTVVLCRRR